MFVTSCTSVNQNLPRAGHKRVLVGCVVGHLDARADVCDVGRGRGAGDPGGEEALQGIAGFEELDGAVDEQVAAAADFTRASRLGYDRILSVQLTDGSMAPSLYLPSFKLQRIRN